jgi:small subunit ribosomal protein S9
MSSLTAGSAIESTPAETAPLRRVRKGADAAGWYWGTGRRKTAIARVRVKPGNGTFLVKAKPMDQFFTELRDRNDINAVLEKTGMAGKLEIRAGVLGGGFTGQAGAIVLGLGRALLNYDPALEPILRENAFLTRDSRKVERKKYGQSGARRRFQFSKR